MSGGLRVPLERMNTANQVQLCCTRSQVSSCCSTTVPLQSGEPGVHHQHARHSCCHARHFLLHALLSLIGRMQHLSLPLFCSR